MKRVALLVLVSCSISITTFAQVDPLEVTSDGEVIVNTNLTIVGEMTLPPGFIYGLETSMTEEDPNHDITINSGKCRSYSDKYNLVLSAPITKQIDESWVAGDQNGGRFFGSTVYADTTYHLFLIRRDSDGYIDAGWDTDIDCGHIPSGYTAYRRIRSLVTDSNANIIPMIDRGDGHFEMVTPTASWTTTAAASTQINLSCDYVPTGLRLRLDFTISGRNTGDSVHNFGSPDMILETPSEGSAGGDFELQHDHYYSTSMEIVCNEIAQISHRSYGDSPDYITGILHGWYDSQGQYGGK